MDPLPLRPLGLRCPNWLGLGTALPGRCLLGPGIRGLGAVGGPRGVGAPCPEGNVLRIRQPRTVQHEHHERERQPGPGDQRVPEHQRHQQHYRGQPDDLHHGPSVLRRPERCGEREGGLREAPEHRRGEAPHQARGDELHPGSPGDPRGEAPTRGCPEGRCEGTEAIPSAGQGTGPIRLPSASEARPPGGQESRGTEARHREGQGAAAGPAQGTARPGGIAREPAGSGGAARQAEGSGAEGDREAGSPASRRRSR